jgi:hypothetical protein
MDKQKLTLFIDSGVIVKAKMLGLNLSEVSESALQLTSFEKDEGVVNQEKVVAAYLSLFETIAPIIKKWQLHLLIGKLYDEDGEIYDYYLTFNSVYVWDSRSEETGKVWKLDDADIPIKYFYEPDQIFRELIDSLVKTAEYNKEKVRKLELVQNVLKLSGL